MSPSDIARAIAEIEENIAALKLEGAAIEGQRDMLGGGVSAVLTALTRLRDLHLGVVLVGGSFEGANRSLHEMAWIPGVALGVDVGKVVGEGDRIRYLSSLEAETAQRYAKVALGGDDPVAPIWETHDVEYVGEAWEIYNEGHTAWRDGESGFGVYLEWRQSHPIMHWRSPPTGGGNFSGGSKSDTVGEYPRYVRREPWAEYVNRVLGR